MKISGSGKVNGGVYNEEIFVSGSAVFDGDVKCGELNVSGSVNTKCVECDKEINISGSGKFEDVKTQSLAVSGSFSADSLTVYKDMKISGSCKVRKDLSAKNAQFSGSIQTGGNIKFGAAAVSGKLECKKNVEAEDITVTGRIYVDGLLNAENTVIKFGYGAFTNRINSIGGTNIKIVYYKEGKFDLRDIIFDHGNVITKVEESIEGDNIFLQNTECPLVVGKNVTVGYGCKIGKIQYYNKCEIKDDAIVGKREKI